MIPRLITALVILVTTALPASAATIEVYPEHRQIYQRTFLLLRDAVECRLPDGARGPSDANGRGVRVKLDDFAVYETGQVEYGGSEARTRVAYGDPDDVVVSLPASSGTPRTIQAVVECRSAEGQWREVGRTTYPSVNGDESGAIPQRVPLSDPVLSGPLTFPCLEGRCGKNPVTMAVDGREIPDRNATRTEAGQAFDVLQDLEPGVRLLEVAGAGWSETFPVIGAFADGSPPPLAATSSSPALGTEVAKPVPWILLVVLIVVALGLLAVVAAVWRGGAGGRGRRVAIGLGLVSLVAVMVSVVVVVNFPSTESRPAADRNAADLRAADLHAVLLPAGTCESAQPFALSGRESTSITTAGGAAVQVRAIGEPLHGDVDGDSNDEAALSIACVPEGGNMVLAQGFLLFTGSGGQPRFLAFVTAQYQGRTDYPRTGVVDRVVITPGAVRAVEFVFGANDPQCCPTGRAITDWTYQNGILTPIRSEECATEAC